MTIAAIDNLTVETRSSRLHTARVFGPRPGVPNGSANDPSNLFIVDSREHPFGVGAGLPEPAGLLTDRRRTPFFRGTDYRPADQQRLSQAMVDLFGDGSIIHGHYAWGPNFYGSGPTFAQVSPAENPWTVVTYLQSLVGAGAEREPNLALTLDTPEPLSLQTLFQALTDEYRLTAAIVAGIVQTSFLSSRDWIKPAVYGERYGLKIDEYRTRMTIANPTHQFIVAYVERNSEGVVAVHTHVGSLWGEQLGALFAYEPTEPALIFDGPYRLKHLYHINHSTTRPAEDSTVSRARLYVYATPTVERIME